MSDNHYSVASGGDALYIENGNANAEASQALVGAAATVSATSAAVIERPDWKHHFCLRLRLFLESGAFSLVLGTLLFVGGVSLIAVSSFLPKGDFFLIGPFCIAAGVILLIRGCVNKIAKRQDRNRSVRGRFEQMDVFDQMAFMSAMHAAGLAQNALTREERTQRVEEQAIAEDNLNIPPTYSEVTLPKPRQVPVASVASQANLGISTPAYLTSVQSQTNMPSMHSIGLDTSDLTSAEADNRSEVVGPPPTYDQATSPHGSALNIYLGEENEITSS